MLLEKKEETLNKLYLVILLWKKHFARYQQFEHQTHMNVLYFQNNIMKITKIIDF